jgi:hypothetical protein
VVSLADPRFARKTFANLSHVDCPQNLWSTACPTAAVALKTEHPTSRAAGHAVQSPSRRWRPGSPAACGTDVNEIDVGPIPIAMIDSDDAGGRIALAAWKCLAASARLRESLCHNCNVCAWRENIHGCGPGIDGQACRSCADLTIVLVCNSYCAAPVMQVSIDSLLTFARRFEPPGDPIGSQRIIACMTFGSTTTARMHKKVTSSMMFTSPTIEAQRSGRPVGRC